MRGRTTELYLIYLEIELQYLASQQSGRKNMAICDAFYVTIFLFSWRTPLSAIVIMTHAGIHTRLT